MLITVMALLAIVFACMSLAYILAELINIWRQP